MADSASESDSSSIDGGLMMMPPSPVSREQLYKRVESLQQQNRVLKVELDTFKLRVKSLQEENRALRQASVNIQAKAEQEEEFISNTLLKKIQALKKEKETLAHHYEQEEECLTNDLSRKLNQLRQEKCKLEQTLEQEQECLVNKLMRKIEKLEAETNAKQNNLDQLRREKVELENTLEQEQEALVNRLWKRMDKLEAEKRNLQSKIEMGQQGDQSSSSSSDNPSQSSPNQGQQGLSLPPSSEQPPLGLRVRLHSSGSVGLGPHSPSALARGGEGGGEGGVLGPLGIGIHHHPHRLPLRHARDRELSGGGGGALEDDVITLSSNVQHLRTEVDRLKAQLNVAQQQHSDKMAQFAMEERQIREENLRLQRRLQLEMERREALCRHLSESESSLEMEDERHFHETMAAAGTQGTNILNHPLLTNSLLCGGNHAQHQNQHQGQVPGTLPQNVRPRPGSSPGPFVPSPGSRPISPGSSSNSRDIMMSPPSPVSRCHQCNGHGWVGPITPLVVSTSASGLMCSSSSPPIRHSSRERFARPAAPPSAGTERSQEPRTPGDSTMTSPSPSPSPLEVVMSPAAAPSPMDTTTSTSSKT